MIYTTEPRLEEANTRDDQIPLQGVGGFDQCWYPVALSREIGSGSVMSKPFLDGRVIVMRGESGKASVLSPFCRHMGADLSVGEIVGDSIRCAFHHWCYDGEGKCVQVPASPVIPQRANLFRFPTEERLGLIWAFNGDAPLYPLIGFLGAADEDMIYEAVENYPLPLDPFMPVMTTLDLQHLEVVHQLRFADADNIDLRIDPYGIRNIRYRLELPDRGWAEHEQEIWGSNAYTFIHRTQAHALYVINAGTPEPGNQSRHYAIIGLQKDDTSPERLQAQRDEIKHMIEVNKAIGAQDLAVFRTMRFRMDSLIRIDRYAAQVLRFIRNFPRAHPARDMIR